MDAILEGMPVKPGSKLYAITNRLMKCANGRLRGTTEPCVLPATITSITFELDDNGDLVWYGDLFVQIPVNAPTDTPERAPEILRFTPETISWSRDVLKMRICTSGGKNECQRTPYGPAY